MALAETIVYCLGAYLAVGVIVAILFLAFSVARIDHAAKGASLFFRPMIFFGCVAIWPFVIIRFLSKKTINEPAEVDE